MRVAAATFGLIVQAVEDVQEIVVKPLGSPLAHLKVYSGQTILGDGSVVLILDSGGIAETLGLERAASYRAARADAPRAAPVAYARRAAARGPGARKALPLSLITRIESVDTAAIEQTGAGYVLRHRGQLMPLLPAAEGVAPSHANQPVLVIGYGGETMGLLVDEIIDIVEDPLEIQIAQGTPGVIGTAEFGGVVAELLDLTHFIRIGRPNSASRGVNRKFKVLLVDDRQFFRDMLTPVLSAAGYKVTTLGGAPEALALIDKGAHFDAIVTDIDMPEVDGYRFARDLRAMARCARADRRACRAGQREDTLAAKAAGIDAIAGKFDRRALLETLGEALDETALGEQSSKINSWGSSGMTAAVANAFRSRRAPAPARICGAASSPSRRPASCSACRSTPCRRSFRLQAITPVPLGPPVVAGLVNLRGKIVVALSLDKRLGLQSNGAATSALAVAVERRGETFALIVDSVGDAIECEEHERISSPRHIHDDRARLTAAYYRTAGGILPILDIDALFDMRADALTARISPQPSVNGHPGASP